MKDTILLVNPFAKGDGVDNLRRERLAHDSTSSKSGLLASKALHVAPDANMCECTAGWWMFGLGWVLVLPWVAGAALPCVDRRQKVRANVARNNRRAALGSIVMLVVSMCAGVVVYFAVTACQKHGCAVSLSAGAPTATGASLAAPPAATSTSDGTTQPVGSTAPSPADAAQGTAPGTSPSDPGGTGSDASTAVSPSPAASSSTDMGSPAPLLTTTTSSSSSSPGIAAAGASDVAAPAQPQVVEAPSTGPAAPGPTASKGAAGTVAQPVTAVPKPAAAAGTASTQSPSSSSSNSSTMP